VNRLGAHAIIYDTLKDVKYLIRAIGVGGCATQLCCAFLAPAFAGDPALDRATLRQPGPGVSLAQSTKAAEPTAPRRARYQSNDRGRVASVTIAGCRASLEYERSSTLLVYDNGCPQSTTTKAAILDRLLSTIFDEAGIPGHVGALRIGWLARFSDALSRRVALRAHQSAEWQAVLARRAESGPGDHGLVGGFVGRLVDAHDLYPEIRRVMREHGAVITATRAEKPFLGVPSMTRSKAWLLDHGVAAEQLLPLDAIVTFVLERPPQ
jgi:hypothetical protein